MEKELKIKLIILVAMKIVTGVKNHVSINDNHKTLAWVFTLRFKGDWKLKRTTVNPNKVRGPAVPIQKFL